MIEMINTGARGESGESRYNFRRMSRPTLALLVFLAGVTALAQPGLCPCWLVPDVRTDHPHPFAHSERPHPHDYLLELFNAETAAVAPQLPIPARTLILVLAISGLLWRMGSHAFSITDLAT